MKQRLRPSLLILLIAYLAVGAAYALLTPAWQVPDEPAHYNYIRQLAESHRLPVMEPGDYDQAYLERLTREHFPPTLSIASLTYEDHQPPLYYLLLLPVYWLSGGALWLLRLTTLLFGASGVMMTALMVEEIVPENQTLALFAAALMAFVPQYVAITAGVNNDALGIALIAAWLWAAMRYLRGAISPWSVGTLTGLLLLTKGTAYITLPLLPLLLLLRRRRAGFGWHPLGRETLHIFLPAIILGGLWWGRNLALYGWPDFTAQLRHAEVVVGQPRTHDWIEAMGIWPFLKTALTTTFRSFWGQFGWMGVVMDARLYRAALILSALAGWGALVALIDALRAGMPPRIRDALTLLSAEGLLTLLLYVGYNLTFVQHQGRYLFPALPALMAAMAVGLRRLTERPLAQATAVLLALITVALGAFGWVNGHLPLWTLAELSWAILWMLVVARTGRRWRPVWGFLLVLAFYIWDWYALAAFILPQLS